MELLEVHRISKYFGGLVAVQEVSFSLKKGQILGIIGPNGAGKTTLFSLISGFYRPDRGEVYFNGKPIHGLRPDEICKRALVRTFQVMQPFSNLTVLDNVTVGALARISKVKQAQKKAMEILEIVQLRDRADEIAGKLTLAQRKCLEVARALATDPQVILMDECMAGLTPTEARQTMRLIERLNEGGLSFLLIEHVMEIIMNLSHRIIVLNYGGKIAEGTPQQILSDRAVIEAYLGEE
jgi:branched-chain amino acid transport system ATP-binding protein